VRGEPSVLHVDLDAFYAAVEQRDKPSLRGRPVVVGGTGPRGVVATASYEARRFGVGSAMSGAEARARCPNAAFLAPRFEVYRAVSDVVMATLREVSPLVEPLSLDEAYVDLAAGADGPLPAGAVHDVGAALRSRIRARTGVTASVGAGSSKLVAKVASDLDKPDGLHVVAAGGEQALLDALPPSRLWGVGPVTAARLGRLGVRTVADLRRLSEAELVGLLGQAHGVSLWHLARGEDDRPVVAVHESKSVSAEDTFATDLTDRAHLGGLLDGLATKVASRLRGDGLSGRTVTVKVRRHDFETLTRSATLRGPTDDVRTIARTARRLLGEVDTADGVRLLGVGVSSLATWTQEDLFDAATRDPDPDGPDRAPPEADAGAATATPSGDTDDDAPRPRRWVAGQDVVHTDHGPGWVQGSGVGRVTVRFETRETPPGRVRTFAVDDPALTAAASG
jgi:DNA polymerase IV